MNGFPGWMDAYPQLLTPNELLNWTCLPFTCSPTPNVSKPQIPYLYNEYSKNIYLLELLWELNELICLAHSRYIININYYYYHNYYFPLGILISSSVK